MCVRVRVCVHACARVCVLLCVRAFHGSVASVHFQHSAELVSRLVKAEANYSLQMYPDEGHELRDPRSIQHLQRTLVNSLQSCMRQGLLLAPVEEPEEDDDN